MKFLFIEPFFGGSHRNFAEGLQAHSRHTIDLLTLPARFWKWRMRGAALFFVKKIPLLTDYDGLITTNLMSMSDFKALCGCTCPPSLVYFHENQVTYPLAPNASRDFQFGFTDITSALAADQVLFNSHTHFDAFFSNLPDFLNMMPEHRPKWVLDAIRLKTRVAYPGCHFPATETLPTSSVLPTGTPPLIIWNHRWEFDKNPRDFFDALDTVLARGVDFRLALLGENFQKVPKEFISARDRLGRRIVQYGHEASRDKYLEWLMQGAIVISTARQENFGISVIEAVRYGCIPLLPHRLSYPEIIPKTFHPELLYRKQTELVDKLCHIISNAEKWQKRRDQLSRSMACYAWENRIHEYDEILENLARL